MDYRGLKVELAKPKYAGQSAAQKAVALRAEMVARALDIMPGAWREALASAGLWGRLVLISRMAPTGALGAPTDQDRVVARVIDLVTIAELGAETRKGGVAGRVANLLLALVADGVIADPVRLALVGTLSEQVARAVLLGFEDLTDQDVLAAEALRNG